MGNYLSGGNSGVITDGDRAILSLKAQRKKLEDQMKLLERRADQSAAAARELLAEGRRDRALVALRRKRLADNQYGNISAWLMRVEELLSGMETARQQQAVVSALKDGAAALRAAQRALSVEDVERLNEQTAEAREHHDRVRAALESADFGEADEAAVEAELAALEADAEREEELAAMPSVPKTKVEEVEEEEAALPAAPTARVPAAARAREAAAEEAEAEEEEEARRLEPALAAA